MFSGNDQSLQIHNQARIDQLLEEARCHRLVREGKESGTRVFSAFFAIAHSFFNAQNLRSSTEFQAADTNHIEPVGFNPSSFL